MNEVLLKLFQVPEIKKMTNCVCFALGNPFAWAFRGAWNDNIVLAEIAKIEPTDTEEVNDIHIWYGNDHCHFGVEFVKGYILTQHGRGGPIRAYKSEVAMEMGTDYYPEYKRVKTFHLPIRPTCKTPVADVLFVEESCKDPDNHAAIISIFRDEARNFFKGVNWIKDNVYQKYREWIVSPNCPYGKRFPSIPLGEFNEQNISRDSSTSSGQLRPFQPVGVS